MIGSQNNNINDKLSALLRNTAGDNERLPTRIPEHNENTFNEQAQLKLDRQRQRAEMEVTKV
jgi:hypothetical protein